MTSNSFIKVDSSVKNIINGNILEDTSREVLGINGEFKAIKKDNITGETNIIQFPHVDDILYPKNISNNTERDPLIILKMLNNQSPTLNSFRSRKGNRTRRKTGSRTKSRTGSRTKSRTGSRTKSRTGSRTKSRTGSRTKSRTGSRTKSRTGSRTKSRTGSRTKSRTE